VKRNVFPWLFVVCWAFLSGCSSLPREIQTTTESSFIKSHIFSTALNKAVNVNIYLPPDYSRGNTYPVLYMLHGYTDNEDKWMPNLHLEKNANDLIQNGKILPLIIVMPQIDNSFGLNTNTIKNLPPNFSSGRYEDYLIDELIPYIDAKYSTIRDRDGRFIGGLSMGGWAALHLAFSHTELFSKVGGHSPALMNDNWLYPNFDARAKLDPVVVASEKDLTSLRVYLDCGDRDSFKFYEGSAQLYTALQAAGVPSEYHLNSGEHNDTYWKSHADDYLLFYAGKQ
jgi:enterochelin esterase-like enzyme